MNKRALWLLAIGAMTVGVVALPLCERKSHSSRNVDVHTTVFNPGISITSKGAPTELRDFPLPATVPLVAFLASTSWAELAPFYAKQSRAVAGTNGQGTLINERRPGIYFNTIASLSTVLLPDGSTLLIVQKIPREFSGNTNTAGIWAPVTLVSEHGKWKIDLQFEGTSLNWFLQFTSPEDLINRKIEFERLVTETLARSKKL